MTVDTATKTRENRLRRMATRRGLRLEKSPRRDQGALDYNRFALIDVETNKPINAPLAGQFIHSLTLDAVEYHLTSKKGKRKS